MFIKPTPAPRDKCALPFRDPGGRIVFYDVQSAEPGAFTVPGVIDLEIYDPGSSTESSWIFFKGDPMAGPQPGHPFEMPFDRYRTNFTLDLVADADPSSVLRNIMRESLNVPRYSYANQERSTDQLVSLLARWRSLRQAG